MTGLLASNPACGACLMECVDANDPAACAMGCTEAASGVGSGTSGSGRGSVGTDASSSGAGSGASGSGMDIGAVGSGSYSGVGGDSGSGMGSGSGSYGGGSGSGSSSGSGSDASNVASGSGSGTEVPVSPTLPPTSVLVLLNESSLPVEGGSIDPSLYTDAPRIEQVSAFLPGAQLMDVVRCTHVAEGGNDGRGEWHPR